MDLEHELEVCSLRSARVRPLESKSEARGVSVQPQEPRSTFHTPHDAGGMAHSSSIAIAELLLIVYCNGSPPRCRSINLGRLSILCLRSSCAYSTGSPKVGPDPKPISDANREPYPEPQP